MGIVQKVTGVNLAKRLYTSLPVIMFFSLYPIFKEKFKAVTKHLRNLVVTVTE